MWRFSSPYHIKCRNSQLACSLLKENNYRAVWKSPVCENQGPIMPKPTKSSAWGATEIPPPEELTPSSQEELSSSDQEPDPEITFPPPRQHQPVPTIFMPYIEGPQNGLYC